MHGYMEGWTGGTKVGWYLYAGCISVRVRDCLVPLPVPSYVTISRHLRSVGWGVGAQDGRLPGRLLCRRVCCGLESSRAEEEDMASMVSKRVGAGVSRLTQIGRCLFAGSSLGQAEFGERRYSWMGERVVSDGVERAVGPEFRS